MKINPESIEQIKVCEWIKQIHPDIPFLHLANERACSIQYGMLLKRMGVMKGASDIFIPKATKNFHGLFIELKVGSNRATPSQLEFIERMISEGYAGFVAYGADEAISIIKSIYDLAE